MERTAGESRRLPLANTERLQNGHARAWTCPENLGLVLVVNKQWAFQLQIGRKRLEPDAQQAIGRGNRNEDGQKRKPKEPEPGDDQTQQCQDDGCRKNPDCQAGRLHAYLGAAVAERMLRKTLSVSVPSM